MMLDDQMWEAQAVIPQGSYKLRPLRHQPKVGVVDSLPGVPVGKFFCPAHYMTVHVGDQVVLCFQLGQDLADTGFFFLFPGFQAAFFVRVTVSSLYVPCSTACIFIRICGKDTPSSIRRGGISAPSFFFLDFSLIL